MSDISSTSTPSREYVTNAAWLRTTGRPDSIDEVADQFERPTRGAEEFWTSGTTVAWPRTPRAWVDAPERRAG